MTGVQILFSLVDMSVFMVCAIMILQVIPQKREVSKLMRGTAWAVYALLSVLLPRVGRNDVVTMVVLIIYYMFVGWFLYHESKVGLLYQLCYMVFLYATQVMAIFLSARIGYDMQLENGVIGCLMVLFKVLFLLIITRVLKWIIGKRYVEDQKYLKIRGMVLVPLISLVLMFMYLIAGEVFFALYGYGWLIVYCLLMLVLNGYCIYFWYDVAANRELKHKVELMQQQNELTHQYYEELEENYNQSRKVIHDIRNHLQVLEQSQVLQENQKYFSDVHEMLNSLGLRFYSDSRMLNIVLNDKLKNLPSKQVECCVGNISLHFLEDVDITTIFANLLDNAVEAREEWEDFWLEIRGEQIQDFVVVKISNPCKGEYLEGKSAKKGHEGLGLINVKRAVEKYQGEIKIECKENIFSVTVVFPGQ